jgi:hypothetical protein
MKLFVELNEREMRQPKADDRLTVCLTSDPRTYTVINRKHLPASMYTVQFAESTSGKRIGHCNCKDFTRGNQCKHLRVAAGLHLARNKAKVLDTCNKVSAVLAPLTTGTPTFVVTRNGRQFVGGIQI